tara:strand:- start:3668 stop:3889 length:222 start_codon:yes stop_codon:yes gene_type:complete
LEFYIYRNSGSVFFNFYSGVFVSDLSYLAFAARKLRVGRNPKKSTGTLFNILILKVFYFKLAVALESGFEVFI